MHHKNNKNKNNKAVKLALLFVNTYTNTLTPKTSGEAAEERRSGAAQRAQRRRGGAGEGERERGSGIKIYKHLLILLCIITMNSTIYMTYHSLPPESVIRSWLALNPSANIDFSVDADCIAFLVKEFNPKIAELFKYIWRGMYKADLWRLCKLYIHGGVYADIDLVPFRSLDQMTGSVPPSPSHSPTFYSCLSLGSPSVFQAFMKHTRARSPLLLGCLLSFLVNKPYTNIDNGPTNDMYHFLLYNVRADIKAHAPESLEPFTQYTLRKVRIPIHFSSRDEHIVQLHYFPVGVTYTLSVSPNTRNQWILANKDKLHLKIENQCLIVSMDADADADDEGFIIDICIDLPDDEPEVIYFFQENIREPPYINTCYIADCNEMNIMDCRAPNYIRDRGWVK